MKTLFTQLQSKRIVAASVAGIFMFSILSCSEHAEKKTTTEVIQKETKDSIVKENKKKDLKPAGEAPEWGKSMTPEMLVVIEKLESLGGKPIETLDAKEARQQPTPADAVLAVMKDYDMTMPPALCDTVNKQIPVTGGTTTIRIYTPKQGTAPYPVIVYYHGGGFVIADLDVYGASAQSLCEQSGAVVVSVEYPKGPEHKFPAAHNVCFDAYKWIIKNAASLHADASKIALVGESAGGNIAINVSILARDKKIQMPLYEVLVYPVVNNDLNAESYVTYAAAKPLNKPMMEWFVKNYLNTPKQSEDPRISVVRANLNGLPPTLIIGAEIDPLQSEGELLNKKLKDAKVDSQYELYKGVTHEFFGMAAVIPQAKDAQALAVKKIKAAFDK
jgi:acetyl esterase